MLVYLRTIFFFSRKTVQSIYIPSICDFIVKYGPVYLRTVVFLVKYRPVYLRIFVFHRGRWPSLSAYFNFFLSRTTGRLVCIPMFPRKAYLHTIVLLGLYSSAYLLTPISFGRRNPRGFECELLCKSCPFGQLTWRGPFRGDISGQARAKGFPGRQIRVRHRFATHKPTTTANPSQTWTTMPKPNEKPIRDTQPERKATLRRQTRTKSRFTTPSPNEEATHDAKQSEEPIREAKSERQTDSTRQARMKS